jgi:hypothetical protein
MPSNRPFASDFSFLFEVVFAKMLFLGPYNCLNYNFLKIGDVIMRRSYKTSSFY